MLQHNLSEKYKRYIDARYQEAQAKGEATTKKQLYVEIPHPTVEIRPLTTKASVEEFIAGFATVRHIEFRFLDTNEEFPGLETHLKIREMKRQLDARSTKLSHNNPAGLNKTTVTEQIHTATAAGNEAVRVLRKSPQGADLKGNNEDLEVRVPIERLPEKDADRAAHLVHIYQEQVESGILIEDVAPDATAKIRRLIDELYRR